MLAIKERRKRISGYSECFNEGEKVIMITDFCYFIYDIDGNEEKVEGSYKE